MAARRGAAVGAGFARIVELVDDTVFQILAGHERLAAEESLAHPAKRLQRGRYDAGNDDGGDLAMIEPGDLDELNQQCAIFLGRALAIGRKAPLTELLALAIKREHRIGIADIDQKEHGTALYLHGTDMKSRRSSIPV